MSGMKRMAGLVAAAAIAGATVPADAAEYTDGGRALRSAGPRFGLVYVTGDTIKAALRARDASPMLTAFGWQFEYEYLNTGSGTTGLVEFVPLLVGMESGMAIPSLNTVIGVRFGNGIEVGVGPNLSGVVVRSETEPGKLITHAGIGMAGAIGITARSGRMNFPVNLAGVRNRNGMRVALMVGWTL